MPDFAPMSRPPLFSGRSEIPVYRNGTDGEFGAERLPIAKIIAVIRRHILFALSIAAICVLATALYVRNEERFYRAVAVVRLADARSAITTGLEEEGAQPERLTSPLLSQIQLLRSRALVGRVVDSIGLRLEPDFRSFKAGLLTDVRVDTSAPTDDLRLRFGEREVVVRGNFGETRARYGDPVQAGGARFTILARPKTEGATWPVLTRENAIDHVLVNLQVKPRVSTNVVDVTFTGERPIIAQRVVNALVETFETLNTQAARERSRRRRVFLAEQLERTDSVLARAQLDLSEFRRRAQVFNTRDKLEAQQKDLIALEVRREEMDADRQMYQSLLERLQGSTSPEQKSAALRALVSSREIATNPVVAQLYGLLVRYQTTRDSLTTGAWKRSDTDPDVERFNELIGSTEEQLLGAVSSHIASLDARIAALDGLRNRTVTSIEALPEIEAEEVRLLQQVETTSKMGEQLREEHQKARMAEAVEVGQVEIVDLAALPYEPMPRMRPLKLALGLILGLVLGGGGAFLLEMRNKSIRRRDELEGALRIRSLGVIPKVAASLPAIEDRERYPLVAQLLGDGESGATPRTNGNNDGLLLHSHLPTAASEAYRVLRTNLIFSEGAQLRKTIVVTSAAPGEGKTVTAANLAITFAREGLRVLLVDADLRRPRLHTLFRVPQGPGLSEQLVDQDPPATVVHSTQVDGLFLLTSGPSSANPDALLQSARMRSLLLWLSGQFDLIILDTPPVLATADAVILGALADGVLLVVRAGETERAAVQHALQQLDTVRAHVVGAVLNDPRGELPTYGKYLQAYAPSGSSGR